jgi:AraC-like DNA-binding protein
MDTKRENISPDLKKLKMPIIKEMGLIHSRAATALPWHINSGFELTYAFSGEFIWEIDQRSSIERLQLTGGVLGLTPPNIPHRGYDSLIAPGELLFIVFDPTLAGGDKDLGWTAEELGSFRYQWEQIGIGTATVNSRAKNSCRMLASLLKNTTAQKDNPLWQCGLRTAILQVLLAALSCFQNPVKQKGNPFIHKACSFIEDNYFDNLSIDDIAHAAGFEKSRFYELFTSEMGQTPGDYFSRVRCRKALALLRETERSVTEIAFNCGYSSSQYFASVVRKYTGCSPREYRHKIQQ